MLEAKSVGGVGSGGELQLEMVAGWGGFGGGGRQESAKFNKKK